MSTVEEILNRAFRCVVTKIWDKALPRKKYLKKVKNRNELYRKNIRLGKVRKVKKGGK